MDKDLENSQVGAKIALSYLTDVKLRKKSDTMDIYHLVLFHSI